MSQLESVQIIDGVNKKKLNLDYKRTDQPSRIFCGLKGSDLSPATNRTEMCTLYKL